VEKKTEKFPKLIIVINGRSGVGKDTLINFTAGKYSVKNVSSVDPIRRIAYTAGWDGVKDAKWRKMMIDVKKALIEYNDFPTKYLVKECGEFLHDSLKPQRRILFVHIREPEEIIKFRNAVAELSRENNFVFKTLLVTRESAYNFKIVQDDELLNLKYDIVFANDKPIEESGENFLKVIESLIL
jgi:hypothetical protein